jgi:hypothetical protein
LNGTHQTQVYADDAYLLGENINIVKTQTLLDVTKKVGLEVNARIQDKIIVSSWVINTSKMWGNSDIWK